MSALAGRTPPAPGPVRWAVRAYAPLLVLSVVLAMVVVPWVLRAQSQTVYESQALVVARQFTLPLAALPRYGEAVFDNGAVAAEVGRRYGLSTAGSSLIPDKLSVVTGQDSVVMTVTARDSDSELAADIANTAADAYLDELNRPGPGLAVFVLQSAATPSDEPTSGAPGTTVQLAIGALAGGLLGLGLIGLLFVVRRPVVDPHDIEAVVGAPVLGVVRFPGRVVRDPNAVPGLAPVARALARSGAHDVYVVSPPDRRAQRATVARMLVEALARWRPAVLQTYDSSRGGWVRPADGDLGYAPSLVITDVARPLDAGPEAVDSDTLLVVREGTPERRLWDMMADHADSSYLGVVVVRRASWLPVRVKTSSRDVVAARRDDRAHQPAAPDAPGAKTGTGSSGRTGAPVTSAAVPAAVAGPTTVAAGRPDARPEPVPDRAAVDGPPPEQPVLPVAEPVPTPEPTPEPEPEAEPEPTPTPTPTHEPVPTATTEPAEPPSPEAPHQDAPEPVLASHAAPLPGPSTLPWRDASALLGLDPPTQPARPGTSDTDGAGATDADRAAGPGWPDRDPRRGAATGWPSSS